MRFVIKAAACLAATGGLGLLAFAIFSDLPAPTREFSHSVEAR